MVCNVYRETIIIRNFILIQTYKQVFHTCIHMASLGAYILYMHTYLHHAYIYTHTHTHTHILYIHTYKHAGESEWNQKKLFTGWVDVDLSERGKKEIEHAARFDDEPLILCTVYCIWAINALYVCVK